MRKIKKSTKLSQGLESYANTIKAPYQKIVLECDTRWNSTLHMLKSFEKLWKPLSVVCNLNSIKIFFKSQKINAKDTKAKKSGKTNYENYESDDDTFNEKYSEVLGDMSVFNENLMNRVKE